MDNAQRLKILHNTKKTVTTAKLLRELWHINDDTLKTVAKRMVDSGLLVRLGKGVYALSENFNPLELANTLVTPSYISFHTALVHHGIAFQVSQRITSASAFPYERRILGVTYSYKRLKKNLLYNTEGIKTEGTVAIASPERAILDSLYAGMKPNIDNPDKVNKRSLKELSKLYPKKMQPAADTII